MMGAGKSAVGRALAELSGREFTDTDQLLQRRFGRPVNQIFAVYGEAAFRAHETSILKSLAPGPSVVSTGGGIVAREENWREMRRLGLTAYLDAPEDELLKRLAASKKRRPLLETEDWEGRVSDLLGQRAPMYRQADVVVPIAGLAIEEAARLVHEAFLRKEREA